MNMSEEEYFFHEWLIIEKKMKIDEYKDITNSEFNVLKIEFLKKYYPEKLMNFLKE